jgi:endonuclease/exonuclease/phosphatase family metal-dependent hydrolase
MRIFDARTLAEATRFKALAKEGKRIDWILARGPVATHRTEIVTFSKNGQFPSDHCPVVAWLELEPD